MYGNAVHAVADLLRGTAQLAAASEYYREETIDAVADACPYLLSQPIRSEELYGNAVHAVAHLLRGTAFGAAASEYFREETIDAVADAYPYLLSQPIRCEYLLGNTIHAVASVERRVLEGKESPAMQMHRRAVVADLLIRDCRWPS